MNYSSWTGVLLCNCLLGSQKRCKRPCSAGFTLIEMLVVIIIVAILAAIALPAFLSQARRAQQGEALTYIGTINRAQQVYRLDSITFADSLERLGVGLVGSTEFYQYSVVESSSRLTHAAAIPRDESLVGFSGIVSVLVSPDGTAVTSSKVCQGDRGNTPDLSFSAAESNIDIFGCDAL